LVETLSRSFPSTQEKLKTEVLYDLTLGTAQAWLITEGKDITASSPKAAFITKVVNDHARGGKVLSVLAACAFSGASVEMFIEGFNALKVFGKEMGCLVVDFYTNNRAIEKYLKGFDFLWQARYYQLSLEEN
jgi:hypothetical protein